MGNRSIVLVTGATGAIGPTVVKALCKSGYRVRTLSLEKLTGAPWPKEPVESFTGDVTSPEDVSSAMQGVDAIVHLAALLHIVNPSEQLRDRYRKINVGGTKTVVEFAVKFHVKRIVFFSTIAVYGKSHGRILDEDSPPEPDTFYGQTKLEAENIVLSATDGKGHPLGTVLRLAAVYGPRLKGNYEHLLKALQQGWFIPVGKGRNRRTLVHVEDVATAATLTLNHPAAAGRVFNVSDGQHHTLREIIASMCNALGRKVPRIYLPVAPVRVAAAMMEDSAKFLGLRASVAGPTVEKYLEDIAVDCTRIQTELGFKPQYDLISGWRNIVEEMKLSNPL